MSEKKDPKESNDDESKKIFEENFAPFKGNSKWVMIIILYYSCKFKLTLTP